MIFVQVPGINGLGKTKGCENAPCKILRELSTRKLKFKIIEFNLEKNDVEENQKIIFKEALDLFKETKDSHEKIIFLGGDHSISYPIANAFKQVYNLPFLFVLDAHIDCMEPMNEPSHEEWLRALIEQGFESEQIIIVGARKIYQEERDFFEKKRIRIVRKDEINHFLKNPDNFSKLKEFDAVYLSLDVDVLDADCFSATGYLEKNGLDFEQLKEFLVKIFNLKNFKAMDLVEMNPEKDLNNKNLKLIVELVNELAA
jgi:arginase family enzyme